MSEIKNSRIVITGAGGDLGRALAVKLASHSARMALIDIDRTGLEQTVKALSKYPATVKPFVCDLSDPVQIRDTAEAVQSFTERVDILINNAGLLIPGRLWESSDEEVTKIFQVNTLALFRLVRLFLPAMLERNSGHIVTIASAGGLVGSAGLSAYNASKFAAVGFDETLRLELKKAKSAVRTTVVCPYFIDTQMAPGVRSRFPFLLPVLKSEKVAEKILQAIQGNKPRLYMPALLYTLPLLRVLPVSWADVILNFLGVNHAADTIEKSISFNELSST